MSKVLPFELVESSPSLAHDIAQAHRQATVAAQSAIAYALRAGLLLQRAKLDLPHGTFESFIEQECGLNPRTARRYMKLAEGIGDRLTGDAVELLTSDFSEDDLPALTDTLGQATSGATLTQLYMEFGVLKGATPIGGARPSAAGTTSSKKCSLSAAREADVNRLQTLCSQLETQILAQAPIREKVFAASLADTLRRLARLADDPRSKK